MGCCLLAALLVSVARRAWFRTTGRAPAPSPFPPAARRPAARATSGPATPPTTSPTLTPTPLPRRTVLAPATAAALGVLAYAAVTAALSALGLVHRSAHPVGSLPRDVVLATAVGAFLLLAVRSPATPHPPREHRGRCLVAAGLAWTAVLVVDVHALGHGHADALPLDLARHVAGLLALYAGLLLWQPLGARPTTPRTEGAPA